MDATRFDSLVRAFAQGSTRRRLVTLLGTVLFSSVVFGLADDDAAAERPHDRVKRRSKQRNRKQRNEHHRKQRRRRNDRNANNGGGGNTGGKTPGACAPNGNACQQNGDCCGRNCFNQRCSNSPNQCNGIACPNGAAGCCSGNCCVSPANQCNGVGECCAPDCTNKQCGPDGCGNGGSCGTCPAGSECNAATGKCLCTPQTCPNGCCDSNGVCQPGNTEQACGDGGVTCTQCGSNQHCSTQTGTCRDNPPCSAETCPNGCCNLENGFHVCRTDLRGCAPGGACCSGCCDNNGQCQDGDDDGACGAGGSRCIACDPLEQCDRGRCQCDANNCPGCCLGGPGNPGFCEQGNTDQFCGFGGVLCITCPTGTTCNGQGHCTCINTNQFCGTGTNCIACPEGTECNGQGQCVCTAQSCLASSGRSCQNNQCLCDWDLCDGCCAGGLCQPNSAGACRTDGEACTACPGGQQCVVADSSQHLMACCPNGAWHSCGVGGVCCPNNLSCDDQGQTCSADVCCAGGGGCCYKDDSEPDCCAGGCCPEEAPNCCSLAPNQWVCSDEDCPS